MQTAPEFPRRFSSRLDIPGNRPYELMASNSGLGDVFTLNAALAGPGCRQMSRFVASAKDVTLLLTDQTPEREELAPASASGGPIRKKSPPPPDVRFWPLLAG